MTPCSTRRLFVSVVCFCLSLLSCALAAGQTSPAGFPGYRFAVGKSSVWRVQYRSVSNANLRALFEGQAAPPSVSAPSAYTLAADLSGEMTQTTVSADTERI